MVETIESQGPRLHTHPVVPDSWACSVRVGVECIDSGVPHDGEHLLPILTPLLIPERERQISQPCDTTTNQLQLSVV